LESGSEAYDDFEDAEADMLEVITMLANDDDTGEGGWKSSTALDVKGGGSEWVDTGDYI
jgi:hypothetical protein